MSKSRIYLDYASLTPIDSRVIGEMKKFSASEYTNPSSWYKEGVSAKNAMDDGKKRISDFIHAHPDEICFTSGGTEANNLAIIGTVESLHEKGVDYDKMHVLISAIEHSSVRECANYLNGKGVAIDIVSVGKDGIISLDELKKKIRPNTVIVSIMTVNNEIGTIQPIREIAKVIRNARKISNAGSDSNTEKNPDAVNTGDFDSNNPFVFQDFNYPIFHTDASQAVLYEDLNVEQLGIDLLTLDGTKVYGPRGIGTLFIRRNTPIAPVIHGGGQESGLRSGTENIPSIMGFAKALDIAGTDRVDENIRINGLKEYFFEGLKAVAKDIRINPASTAITNSNSAVSPHILNVSIPRINAEFFVMQLDARGIACSTKSSCLRDEDESYVLKSIGADSNISVRFSFGRWTNKGDLKRAIKAIKEALDK